MGSNAIKTCFLGLRELAIPFKEKIINYSVSVKNIRGRSPVCWYSSDNGDSDSLDKVLISFMAYTAYTDVEINYTISAKGY